MLSEGGSVSPTSGRQMCMEPGCRNEANCLPRLWVPAKFKMLGVGKSFDGVASVMGLPMCFKHWKLLRPRDFLKNAEVRASIEQDFRRHGAIAWFERASLHQVRRSEPEFANWLQLHRLARATASA